jgi:hypothetical protein
MVTKKRKNRRKYLKRAFAMEKNPNPPRRSPAMESILIENFVSFQKVMVNLSTKFDELTLKISKLLELFEISAKTLAEKDLDLEKNNRENTKIIEKLDNVLDQNKTIARGLSLMHDKIREPINYYSQPSTPKPPQQKPPQPFKPVQPKTSVMEGVSEEYHRPISSDEQ